MGNFTMLIYISMISRLFVSIGWVGLRSGFRISKVGGGLLIEYYGGGFFLFLGQSDVGDRQTWVKDWIVEE
jgi:hypothetical protein